MRSRDVFSFCMMKVNRCSPTTLCRCAMKKTLRNWRKRRSDVSAPLEFPEGHQIEFADGAACWWWMDGEGGHHTRESGADAKLRANDDDREFSGNHRRQAGGRAAGKWRRDCRPAAGRECRGHHERFRPLEVTTLTATLTSAFTASTAAARDSASSKASSAKKPRCRDLRTVCEVE